MLEVRAVWKQMAQTCRRRMAQTISGQQRSCGCGGRGRATTVVIDRGHRPTGTQLRMEFLLYCTVKYVATTNKGRTSLQTAVLQVTTYKIRVPPRVQDTAYRAGIDVRCQHS